MVFSAFFLANRIIGHEWLSVPASCRLARIFAHFLNDDELDTVLMGFVLLVDGAGGGVDEIKSLRCLVDALSPRLLPRTKQALARFADDVARHRRGVGW